MAGNKLSRAEVERVLQRAAEIESATATADEGEATPGLDAEEVLRLGVEAGLGRDAVARALSERGKELVTTDAASVDDGPGRVRVGRDLPLPRDKVERALDRFMREQLMVVRRHHGDRVEWEKARGLFPGLNRSLDFARNYCFGPAEHIETRIVAAGGQAPATALSFYIDVSHARRGTLTGSLVRATLWLGTGALFARIFGGGVASVVALAIGAACAAGSVIAAHHRVSVLRERVALGPERFMDLLVQKARKSLAPTPDGDTEGNPV